MRKKGILESTRNDAPGGRTSNKNCLERFLKVQFQQFRFQSSLSKQGIRWTSHPRG